MAVGLCAYGITAPDLLDLARAADAAGFDTLWVGEHLLLPVGYASEHPTTGGTGHHHIRGAIVSPDTELVDPFVALGAAAACTTRLRLATGICLLPLRHPLATARAAATVQEASGGRFLLGVGRGWLEEEFAALDVPFDQRSSRFTESIAVLRAAWAGGPFEHHGRHFSFDRVQLTPRRLEVPVIMGGNGPRALRQAAALGDGWFSSGTPAPDEAGRMVDQLRALRADRGAADGKGGEFRCYVRVANGEAATIERYRAAGLADLVIWADQLWPAHGTPEEKRGAFTAAVAALDLPLR